MKAVYAAQKYLLDLFILAKLIWILLTRVITTITIFQRQIMYRAFSMLSMERKHASKFIRTIEENGR